MFNVDGTKNSARNIIHLANIIIDYQGHHEKVIAKVTDHGKNQVILGYMWLKKHSPDIDWTNGEVKMTCCSQSCYLLQEKFIFLQILEKEEVEQAWSACYDWYFFLNRLSTFFLSASYLIATRDNPITRYAISLSIFSRDLYLPYAITAFF